MPTYKAIFIIIGILIGGLSAYWFGLVDGETLVRDMWHADIVVLTCYILTKKEREHCKKTL